MTTNLDPGPKICDQDLSFYYTLFGHVLHEWFWSYGNIHHKLRLILILTIHSEEYVKNSNFNNFTYWFKDTHSENTPSNKTEVFKKSMNMYTWEIGISNQLFIRDSYAQINFPKKWGSQWEKPIFVIGLFRTPHSTCLNINRVVLCGNVPVSFVALWTKKQFSSFF